METPFITKQQFNKIRKFIPVRKHAKRLDDLKVLSAIILVIRYGLPWRQIPEIYGKWKSIYSRFRRWSKLGIIKKIFISLTEKLPKRCTAMIDSTFSKAQRSASSMRSDGEDRALGRSRGGVTTKIHLLCNSDSQPMDFILTGGNVSDIKVAPVLTTRNRMKVLIADKAYGARTYRELLHKRHIQECIPPKCNEKNPLAYDKKIYKTRHIIENMFSRLKDWQGVAFRGNRCAYTFYSFVALALIFIFLNADRA